MTNAFPALTPLRFWVVHQRLEGSVVGKGLPDRVPDVFRIGAVSSCARLGSIAKPQPAVGKLDELTHGSTFRQVIGSEPVRARQRANLLA